MIDNLEKFANEGETYSVLFKKPSDYKLTVRNIIAFMIQDKNAIHVTLKFNVNVLLDLHFCGILFHNL